MKAFYFPHDDNAAGDERVLKLRAKFGNTEGYAMWFMLLEYMSRNGGYVDNSSMAELSLSYSIPPEKWKAFTDYCHDISLLRKKGMLSFSYRLLEHIGFRKERSESGKKGAAKRWNNDSLAIAEPLAKPIAGKESIGEDRKLTKLSEKALTKNTKTDEQTLKEFFTIAKNEQWTEDTYVEAKVKQFYELGKEGKEEILKKMRVMINCTFSKSESTQRMAKKIYHETVGLIQDRALDKGTIDGKTIAKRREFAEEENGKRYVEQELDPAPF